MAKSTFTAIITDYNWLDADLSNSWVYDYFEEFIILDKYHRSVWVGNETVVQQKNVGQNIYDMLDFIVQNYDALPHKMLFARGCLLFPKGRSKPLSNGNCSETAFRARLMDGSNIVEVHDFDANDVDGVFNFIDDGSYYEKVSSWWFPVHFGKYYCSHTRFHKDLYAQKNPLKYTRFSPGAAYIINRDVILEHPKALYMNLRHLVSWDCVVGEAHLLERNLFEIFSSKHDISALYLSEHETFKKIMERRVISTRIWNVLWAPIRLQLTRAKQLAIVCLKMR